MIFYLLLLDDKYKAGPVILLAQRISVLYGVPLRIDLTEESGNCPILREDLPHTVPDRG